MTTPKFKIGDKVRVMLGDPRDGHTRVGFVTHALERDHFTVQGEEGGWSDDFEAEAMVLDAEPHHPFKVGDKVRTINGPGNGVGVVVGTYTMGEQRGVVKVDFAKLKHCGDFHHTHLYLDDDPHGHLRRFESRDHRANTLLKDYDAAIERITELESLVRSVLYKRDFGFLDWCQWAHALLDHGEIQYNGEAAWRKLALTFDRQRMQAMWLLQQVAKQPDAPAAVHEFLAAPPLAGSTVAKDSLRLDLLQQLCCRAEGRGDVAIKDYPKFAVRFEMLLGAMAIHADYGHPPDLRGALDAYQEGDL